MFLPMLTELLEESAKFDLQESIIGMAHRGRVNVLAHVLKKPYEKLFYEFSSRYIPEEGQGDVKYHKGGIKEFTAKNGKTILLQLASNPSHLESVDPVVLGMTKAKQNQGKKVMPILIHGDAAISGQGVVYEMMQLYKVKGYGVDGAIQIVINNQIGYTATPEQYKSTRSCSDIGKAFNFPIFHVNAQNVEAAIYVAKLAADIRNKFKINVIINLYGYRKYGHNETDEPRFTQPILYEKLKNYITPYHSYKDELFKQGFITQEEITDFENRFHKMLDEAYEKSQSIDRTLQPISKDQERCELTKQLSSVSTQISKEKFKELGMKISHIPEDFDPHPKLAKLFEERRQSLEVGIDWATAELLAYSSLLKEGFRVRLSGQDSVRGTFAHRHAYLYSQKEIKRYSPLEDLGPFEVYNSILSEYAVMGFEYGYSFSDPNAFVMWEAQFGDFVNGAQIMIDQYVTSSKTKWKESTSLTLYLPHGLEGMGPEHSSCRLERFLQLTAENNLRVCYPTNASQVFHLFRRQMHLTEKAPLVIASPKSLLRKKESFSQIEDFTDRGFQEFLVTGSMKAKKLLICSGKIYYDLLAHQKEDVAIIRIEQIYPFDMDKFKQIIKEFKELAKVMFVQEEHSNQGIWHFIEPYLSHAFGSKFMIHYVGRSRKASPAAGSHHLHSQEQQCIIKEAYED
ncbi:MAG: 2-oxoglutarate dehydrogenase E1 component [Chlamydiae bacterium]|nr:2-oxoglutarate dehydrogenase E1 component [Chlamydiota bacterium]